MYPYGYYMDSSMLILIPAIILSMYASFKVNSTTSKYFKVRSEKGIPGSEVARRILDANGLRHVPVGPVAGNLQTIMILEVRQFLYLKRYIMELL